MVSLATASLHAIWLYVVSLRMVHLRGNFVSGISMFGTAIHVCGTVGPHVLCNEVHPHVP